MSERVCFSKRVRSDRRADYLERHTAVWPEMLAEIIAAGRRNYTLFLHDDGLLVGYYETDDRAASDAYLADSPIAARWESEMEPYFYSSGRADQTAALLTEVFNLEDSVAAGRPQPEG